MKNVNIINVRRLTNNNFYGFHSSVIEHANDITNKEFRAILEEYIEQVENFRTYVFSLDEATAKKVKALSGVERVKAFRGFRSFIKSSMNRPNKELANLAKDLWVAVKDYGDINAVDCDSVTTIVNSLLDHVGTVVTDEAYAEVYAGSDVEEWVTMLTEVQKEYIAAAKSRETERTARMQDSNNALRETCIETFYTLLNLAKFIAKTKGDKTCAEFVLKVEGLADTRRSLYKSRAKARAKKSAAETKVGNGGEPAPATDNRAGEADAA